MTIGLRGEDKNSLAKVWFVPSEEASPARALKSKESCVRSYGAKVVWWPGAENGEEECSPRPLEGEVPGEKLLSGPRFRGDTDVGVDPIAPNSLILGDVGLTTLFGAEGIATWGGDGGLVSTAISLDSSEAVSASLSLAVSRVSSLVGDFTRAGAEESWSSSSGKPESTKSMSLTGGAGAEGEIVVLNGEGREVLPSTRVGAVDPDSRAFLPSLPFAPEDLGFFVRPPSRPWFDAFACCWANFLFFRSMDML